MRRYRFCEPILREKVLRRKRRSLANYLGRDCGFAKSREPSTWHGTSRSSMPPASRSATADLQSRVSRGVYAYRALQRPVGNVVPRRFDSETRLRAVQRPSRLL